MAKIFSFDAETNGLWGRAFSVAAVVREDGVTTKTFIGRCPITGQYNQWVKENVIPAMKGIDITHPCYGDMLLDFTKFYLENKEDADVIVHMGLPVEARLFIEAHTRRMIDDFDAPYPLIDIAAFPEVGVSVDTYNKEHGLIVPDNEGGTHNPLYDSVAAALCYEHIMRRQTPDNSRKTA